jgi:hypothetical protein
MPKRQTSAASPPTEQDNGRGETTAGYFRRVFAEHPEWLAEPSNTDVFARWLQDHPGHAEVPEKIKQSLFNIKSVLRKELRKKPGRRKKEQQPAGATAAAAPTPRKSVRGLESLELAIDDCLTLARKTDREGLADVIGLLRQARNAVVWKLGERA